MPIWILLALFVTSAIGWLIDQRYRNFKMTYLEIRTFECNSERVSIDVVSKCVEMTVQPLNGFYWKSKCH